MGQRQGGAGRICLKVDGVRANRLLQNVWQRSRAVDLPIPEAQCPRVAFLGLGLKMFLDCKPFSRARWEKSAGDYVFGIADNSCSSLDKTKSVTQGREGGRKR